MHEARTDRLASLDQEPPRHALYSLEDFAMKILFFHAPYMYFDRLERLWADGAVSLNGWQKLITSLLVEWSDSNLLVSCSSPLFLITFLTEGIRQATVTLS